MLQRDDLLPLFPGLDGCVYLNTAAMALGAAPVRAAYVRALDAWTAGSFDFVEAERAGEECRAAVARLLGAKPGEVALVPAVSTAAGIVAAQLGTARPGENVVVGSGEFTSNFLPWVLLRELGYEVRLVPFGAGGPRTEDYAARVDSGTRMLAVSAVQSASGVAVDLAALAERVHDAGGGRIFVDASQAVGAVPVDVRAEGIDFLAVPSHKFLCGTRGMGYLFARDELLVDVRPLTPGWKATREPLASFYGPDVEVSSTASKLDSSLPWFAALAEREALRMLESLGAEAIFTKNRLLVRSLRGALRARGIEAEDPGAPVRSTIASIPVPDAAAVLERFQAAGVKASVRAGRVRVSVHFYNEVDEMERVADLLAGRGGG